MSSAVSHQFADGPRAIVHCIRDDRCTPIGLHCCNRLLATGLPDVSRGTALGYHRLRVMPSTIPVGTGAESNRAVPVNIVKRLIRIRVGSAGWSDHLRQA